MVTARLRRTNDAVAAPAAGVLVLLLGVQLLLGLGSFIARFTSLWIPGGQTTMLLLPVTHRLIASLILGAVVVIGVRALAPGTPQRATAVPAAPTLRLVRG
jgi:hypothetical protein